MTGSSGSSPIAHVPFVGVVGYSHQTTSAQSRSHEAFARFVELAEAAPERSLRRQARLCAARSVGYTLRVPVP